MCCDHAASLFDTLDDVEEYIRGLQVPYPERFVADTLAVYRFEHRSWTGAWWCDMRWQHVRSWRLLSG